MRYRVSPSCHQHRYLLLSHIDVDGPFSGFSSVQENSGESMKEATRTAMPTRTDWIDMIYDAFVSMCVCVFG